MLKLETVRKSKQEIVDDMNNILGNEITNLSDIEGLMKDSNFHYAYTNSDIFAAHVAWKAAINKIDENGVIKKLEIIKEKI